jgi:hypothetical protein
MDVLAFTAAVILAWTWLALVSTPSTPRRGFGGLTGSLSIALTIAGVWLDQVRPEMQSTARGCSRAAAVGGGYAESRPNGHHK